MATATEQLQAFCRDRGLSLQSHADFRAWFDRKIDGTVAICWTLMMLVFVVASFGVVNTLTMNVLEQTRELGVLRALGMQRGQLRKVILAQAVALGVTSLGPGIVVGIALAYVMNLAAEPLQGHTIEFRIEPALVAACCTAALVIAVLAAAFPARRAARLQVIRALQYE
jgi:putative ABC transport system permease protein